MDREWHSGLDAPETEALCEIRIQVAGQKTRQTVRGLCRYRNEQWERATEPARGRVIIGQVTHWRVAGCPIG